MKKYFSILILLSILLCPVGTHSAPTQMQIEEDYFNNDTKIKMTEIASPGKTIIVGKSGKRTVKVIISSRKRQAWKMPDEEAPLNERPRAYEYRVNIYLNNEELLVPESTFSDFYDLNRGKIILNDKGIVLVLDGGDAADGYYVIINMNLERIIRKRIYAECCDPKYLLEETVYHQVII